MRFLKLGGFREKWKKFNRQYPLPATFILCENCGEEQPAFSKAQLAIFFKEPPKSACAVCGYYLPPRKSIAPELRRRVLQADHAECVYCGTTSNLTLDHVVPYSQGGKDSFDNLVACCVGCNRAKADQVDFVAARYGRFRVLVS